MVDAVGITIAHVYSKYNVKNIIFSKVFPPDIPKMNKPKQYNYDKL